RPTSLNRHIGTGRPWDLDRTHGGIQILQPSLGSVESDWYQGTADAIYRNLVHLRRRRIDQVLVLSGDHVYEMDYNLLYATHAAHAAAVTVAVTEVPEEMVSGFGILETDRTGRVIGFQEKPKQSRSRLASVLFPGVTVPHGAEIRDSIVMHDSVLSRHARVDHAIIDKEVAIGEGAVVGAGENGVPNRACPEHLSSGLTVVGKGAQIAEG